MKFILNIFIIASLATIIGCDGSFFQSTLEVDPPEEVRLLAVNAFFNADSKDLWIQVDGSGKLFGEDDNKWSAEKLAETEVKLFSGNELIGTFELPDPNSSFEGGNLVLYLDEKLSTYGNEFRIEAFHPDYPKVVGTETLPSKVIPFDYVYVENGGVDDYGYPLNALKVKFQDPPEQGNYYEVGIFFQDSFDYGYGVEYYFNNAYSSSIDPAGSGGPNFVNVFIKDETFNGQIKDFLVQFENPFDISGTIVVVFNAISEARYRYALSVRAFREAGDFGPFGEPVTIPSNYKDGLGTFGLGNAHIEILDL